MKFVKFEFANSAVETVTGDVIPFFTQDKDVIMCAEIDKNDLKVIRDTGKIYILLRGFSVPPIIGVQSNSPFNAPPNENESKSSTTNGEQRNEGNNKLFIN